MVRRGPGRASPHTEPCLHCPWQKEDVTSPRSTMTLEVIHFTKQWEKLRKESGQGATSSPPRISGGQAS